MTHLRVVTAAARQRLAAWQRSQRLAFAARRVVLAAADAALDALPADPHFSQADAVAARVRSRLSPLGPLLSRQLRSGLEDTARWGHRGATATLRGYLTGRLRTRPLKREGVYVAHRPSTQPLAAAGDAEVKFHSHFTPASLAEAVGDELLDALPEWLIAQLVGSAPADLTRLVDPDDAARLVWRGIAAGDDRRKIEKDLVGLFGGWEASARRVARTAGLQVASASQIAASEQLGDIVAGYQVFSVGDSRVREEHRKRHGTIYWRRPKPGQLGFDAMPLPPVDQPGNRTAFNCRCTLCPVFDDAAMDDLDAVAGLDFSGETGELVPRVLV